MIPPQAHIRLWLVFAFAFAGCAVVAGNLFRIQVLMHEHYLAEAERQHKQKIVLPARRGHIFDRNGEPLAVSAEGLNIYAVPERISDKRGTAGVLASHLGLPARAILERISNDRPFVMIQQKTNPLEVEELRRTGLDGIGFIPSSRRYYSHHSLAAQVIGYVGVDEEGLTGLEFQYDNVLRGEPGWLVVQRDARGKPYNMLDYPIVRQVNGAHLRLTIDAEFQEIVEAELFRSIRKSNARNGCAVAVRPATGEILALANYPPVDLNDSRSFGRDDFLNLAANLPFEPGSTFKVFTGAALLEGGFVSLDETVFCENGVYQVSPRRTVRDVHHYGKISFKQVVAHSSNIGMVKLIQRIPDQQLYRSLRAFGFGEFTGRCFNGEDKGILPAPANWDRTTKTSLAMGYGLLATPLQMAMGYAALANGGRLYEPALVREIVDDSGQTILDFSPREVRTALSPTVALQIRRAMVAVVDSGTGTQARVQGFKVAGKTGTSMKATPETGYGGNGYISSFGGFFPADDAQVAMFIMINEPDNLHRWGGSSAAPVFGEVIRKTLLSRSAVFDRVKLGLPSAEMLVAEREPPLNAETSASLPTRTFDPDPVKTFSDSSGMPTPEVMNLPIRRAVARLTAMGLKVQVSGAVRVIGQRPQPGETVRPGDTVTLSGLPVDVRDNSVSLLDKDEQVANRKQH